MNKLVNVIDLQKCGNFAGFVEFFQSCIEQREILKDITVENMHDFSEILDKINEFMVEFERIITTDNSDDVPIIRYVYLSLLKLRVRAHYMLYLCLNPDIRMPDAQTQFDEYVTSDKFMYNLIKTLLK